jgi:hypothetical protein
MAISRSNRYLNLRGPPLPIVIQILQGQENDLDEFIDLVKSVPNGNSNAHAESFVKGVIEKIQDMQIWPNYRKFYVMLNGTNASKYIAQHWKYAQCLPFLRFPSDALPKVTSPI